MHMYLRGQGSEDKGIHSCVYIYNYIYICICIYIYMCVYIHTESHGHIEPAQSCNSGRESEKALKILGLQGREDLGFFWSFGV